MFKITNKNLKIDLSALKNLFSGFKIWSSNNFFLLLNIHWIWAERSKLPHVFGKYNIRWESMM